MDPYGIILHPFVTEKTMNFMDKNNAIEFVVKRKAVDAIGLKALYDINNMRFKLPKFATGGFVGSTPSSTTASPQMTPINLTIGGQSFGVMSDRDVAEALQRYINTEGGL